MYTRENVPVALSLIVLHEVCTGYRRSIKTLREFPGYKVLEKYLIEKHILPVTTIGCETLKISVLAYSMLLT